MDLDHAVEKRVDALRVAREHHQELVVPVEKLAHFEEIAAKQSDDGPVRAFPERSCALREGA